MTSRLLLLVPSAAERQDVQQQLEAAAIATKGITVQVVTPAEAEQIARVAGGPPASPLELSVAELLRAEALALSPRTDRAARRARARAR